MGTKTNTQKLTSAVGYVRMSTDKQEESPARQRREIEALAARDGYSIVDWYEDRGLTGTESKNRPQFQKMLADATKGKFKAILMYEQSRFSREGIFECMKHWSVLEKAGVRIVTVQRGELRFDDLGGILAAIVNQHGARDESVKLSQRTTSGRLNKLKNGQRVGGGIYGFDREIVDASGTVIHRVSFLEKFRTPFGCKARLVPSEHTDAVDTVRMIFRKFVAGEGTSRIANLLKDTGIRGPRGGYWTILNITRMLANPVYAGSLRAGLYCRGQFSRIDTEGEILVEDTHKGIITKELFSKAQHRLAMVRKTHQARVPNRYLMSGMLICDQCGGRMYGRSFKSGSGKMTTYYSCNRNINRRHCPSLTVIKTAIVEPLVIKAIQDKVLTPENVGRIEDALQRLGANQDRPDHQLKIESLNAKILKAEENLAFADGENRDGIIRVLERLRAQLKDLLKTVKGAPPSEQTKLVHLAALQKLNGLMTSLQKSNPARLSELIRSIIKSVTVHKQHVQHDGSQMRILSLSIAFNPEAYEGTVKVEFDQVAPQRRWVMAADFIKRTGRAVTVTELSRGMKISTPMAHRYVRQATAAGRLKRFAPRKGWIYVE